MKIFTTKGRRQDYREPARSVPFGFQIPGIKADDKKKETSNDDGFEYAVLGDSVFYSEVAGDDGREIAGLPLGFDEVAA